MVALNMTLVAQIINFLILVALLTYIAYKPLTKALADRQQRIMNDLSAAERDKAEAARLLAEYRAQLANAKNEAQAIVDKAIKIGEQTREEILRETREETAKMVKAAQEEIQREREKVLAELRSEVVNLSLLAAAKIIGENMDEQVHRKLVQDFINNLDKKQTGGLPC